MKSIFSVSALTIMNAFLAVSFVSNAQAGDRVDNIGPVKTGQAEVLNTHVLPCTEGGTIRTPGGSTYKGSTYQYYACVETKSHQFEYKNCRKKGALSWTEVCDSGIVPGSEKIEYKLMIRKGGAWKRTDDSSFAPIAKELCDSRRATTLQNTKPLEETKCAGQDLNSAVYGEMGE